MEDTKALATTDEIKLPTTTAPQGARGFEEEDKGDLIIPRIKLVQDLSDERKNKLATAGDLINSLTKEKLSGNFIPVLKTSQNIKWRDRADGGGILCRAYDGKTGIPADTTFPPKNCVVCGQCEFDNTKQGKEAQPLCTKYMNFLGFMEGERFPIVLSFCRTYYAEGKRMFSLAKFSGKDMWATKYAVTTKEESKNKNDWFVIVVAPAGPTSKEDLEFAENIYNMFRGQQLRIDDEDETSIPVASPSTGTAANPEF